MVYRIKFRKAFAIRTHELFTLLFNAADKFGIKISFYHIYCLGDHGHVKMMTDVDDHFVVHREPATSRQDAESISIWDGEEKAGELFVTSKPYYIDYVDAHTALDGPYLFSLRIRSGRRSKGLARRLMNEAIRASPEKKYYALIAFTNIPSRMLTEGLGFKIIGQVIYIRILGQTFRNRITMGYFRPAENDRPAPTSVEVRSDRSS